MKILFLPHWYPNKKNPIDASFIREHAKAASLFNNVVVLHNERGHRKLSESYRIISDTYEDGIRTIRLNYKKIPIPNISYLIYIWSYISAFKKLIREGWIPDIIHAHVYPAGVAAVLLGKIYKIPVAITEHYIYFPPRILTFKEQLKAKFSMNRAHVILPPTKAYQQAFESYGIKNNFKIVPNVVDTDTFYPFVSERKDSKKRILFVGNLVPKKAIPYLLEALDEIKKRRQNFILDIVGDGPKRSEYEKLTKKMGLLDFVIFHGRREKEEVAKFMQNCDFFVMPSIFEGFGVVYIEAMACGKPVIATNVRGPDEIVKKDVGILVPPKDVKALSEAIDYMMENHQNFSINTLTQYVKKNFSYPVVGKLLDNVYNDTIKEVNA